MKNHRLEIICRKEDSLAIIKAVMQIDDGAELEPVVRCKDCKHYTEKKTVAYNGHFCERIVEFVQPCDFCSYGERKDNERKAD